MKRLFYLVFSLILAVGCAGSGKATSDVVSLSISVESPVVDAVVVVYNNDVQEIALDENGCATCELKGVDAAYFTVYHGRQGVKLYAEGGDRPALSFNGNNVGESYNLEGGKTEAVKYLNSVKLIPLPDEDYALSFDEYKEKLAAKENDAMRLLKAGDFSAEGKFAEMEAARIKYSYGAALMMFPVGHMIMSGDHDYKPEQAYYDFVATYMVEDEALAGLEEYREFMAEAMHLLDESNRDVREINPKTVAQIKYAADNIKNAKVKEAVIHHIATVYVDNFGVKNIDELQNLYYTFVKNADMNAVYEAKLQRWDLCRPGRISPDFKAVDLDGKEYTLADFRGKYVYIDMWATWCGPCRREIPYLKKIEEQFAEAQIVFLGLSVDSDKAKWADMVKGGNLSGVQLYLGNESSFLDAYRVEGIPRFILIGKDGIIIDNDMTRPSEPQTAETLNALEGIR